MTDAQRTPLTAEGIAKKVLRHHSERHPDIAPEASPYDAVQLAVAFQTVTAERDAAVRRAEEAEPAPASTPFDAKAWAAAMFKHNKARGDLNISQHDGERGYSVIISDKADAEMAKKCWRGYIAAALRAAHAAGLAEARKVVEDAVPFIACHGAVERVKEHGNIESAENSEAILYRMLLLLGNHGAIERLGLKPAARESAGKASGGGGEDA